MVHRGIATLAGLQMLSFLVLSHYEPEFFLLHWYQSLIYLVIILMLFYFEDHFAYMLGMLAPAVWLLLTYATGVLGGAMRQVSQLMHAQRPSSEVSVMAAISAVLSLLMIGFCAYRWKREYAGLGKGRSTLLISLAVVLLYYGILVVWFWEQIPQAPGG
jgi:hypothetical protein